MDAAPAWHQHHPLASPPQPQAEQAFILAELTAIGLVDPEDEDEDEGVDDMAPTCLYCDDPEGEVAPCRRCGRIVCAGCCVMSACCDFLTDMAPAEWRLLHGGAVY